MARSPLSARTPLRSGRSVAARRPDDGPARGVVLAFSVLLLAALVSLAPSGARGQGVASGAGGSTAAAEGDGFTLAPHEAVYDLRMVSRSAGSPVATAHGTMTYRIEDTCDGWAMESRTQLDLYYNRGDPVRTDWSFISWESKDGTRYRFRIRSERNGTVDELIDGRARMNQGGADGGERGGVADFIEPESITVELGPAVLLPAEHTLRVLQAASEGGRIFTAPLFDGSETAGPMQATAVIAEAVAAGTVGELPDHPLLAGPSWRMVLSFFAADSQSSLPDYEVRLRYHDNGVAEEVIQDFGTMALRAALRDLTPLTDGGC